VKKERIMELPFDLYSRLAEDDLHILGEKSVVTKSNDFVVIDEEAEQLVMSGVPLAQYLVKLS
jgi:hypothetical protein